MSSPMDMELYAKARRIAGFEQALRLIYSAKLEGLFGDDAVLQLTTENGQHYQLARASGILDYLYTSPKDEIAQMTLNIGNQSYAIDDISQLWHGPLRDAVTHYLSSSSNAPDFSNWLKLQHELLDSLNNEALGHYARLQSHAKLKDSAKNYNNLWRWLKDAPEAKETLAALGHDVASLLLQLGSFSGHRTHPVTKMKLMLNPHNHKQRSSLSADEVQQYSPEFAPDVALPLLAVKASLATTNLSLYEGINYRDFMARHFPDAYAQWQSQLSQTGANEADYIPIPIHPLQWPEVAHRFSTQIESGDIIRVNASTIQRPTLSLRTLTPVHRDSEPQIKTTVNMQMTSVVRTLAPARAYNAPVFSDLLTRITAQDAKLAATFRPLAEIGSAYFGHNTQEESAEYKDGFHLAAVFKTNPQILVKDGEQPVTVSSLLSPSPLSGEAILVDIMREAGVHDAATAKAYFARYAQVVINSDVGILARYGVTLEGHQQNTDMVFDANSQPCATMYHDINGGMDVYDPLLKASGHAVRGQIHPVERGIYDELEFPLQQTMHTTFAMHLFPTVQAVSSAFGIPKRALYASIADAVKDVLNDARTRHLPERLLQAAPEQRVEIEATYLDALAQIETALLSRDMETKCLLSMRVAQSPDMKFTSIENPLRSVG